MAESVDATVSNTVGATHPGSSPGPGTEKGEEQSSPLFLCLTNYVTASTKLSVTMKRKRVKGSDFRIFRALLEIFRIESCEIYCKFARFIFMRKASLFIFILLLMTISARAQGLMPLPSVPDEVPIGRPRANYLVEHFWDAMPWKSASSMPVKMETSLRTFAELLPHASADTVFASIDKLLKNAVKKKDCFKALMPMAEATFHADTAMLPSDDVYLPFARAAANFKKFSKEERERYATQAQIIESSAVGKRLPAVNITRRDGSSVTLNDTFSQAQSYVIIIETPESGRFDRVRFAANIAANQLVAAKLLKPILIYSGEAPEQWWSSTETLSSEWVIGQLTDAGRYFDLRVEPAIYMADGQMTVAAKWMPMDGLINNCEQLIQSITKQLEQQK